MDLEKKINKTINYKAKFITVIFLYFSILPKKLKKNFYLICVFATLNSILEFISIASIIPFIQNILPSTSTDHQSFTSLFSNLDKYELFRMFLFIIVTIYVVKSLFLLFFNYLKFKFMANVRLLLSYSLIQKYLGLGLDEIEKKNASTCIRNTESEASLISNLVTDAIIGLVNNSLIIIGLCLLIYLVQPVAFVFSFIFFTISMSLYYFFTKKKLQMYGEIRQVAESKRIKFVQDLFKAFKEISIFNKMNFFKNHYIEALNEYTFLEKRVNFINASIKPILELFAVLSLIVFVMSSFLSNGDFTKIFLEISIIAACAFRILPLVNGLIHNFLTLKYQQPALEVINRELSPQIEVSDKSNDSLDILKFENAIELNGVSFGYENSENILKNINIKINKNDIIGISGVTGSGKSTLIDILCGFRRPNEGKILLNEEELNLDRKYLIDVSYVSQEMVLIGETIKKNVAFGIEQKEINETHVNNALVESNMFEFVNSLPKKLDTSINDMASNFSGGQRQRLSIARAYHHDANLLIMDEPTSSLDTSTINKILLNLIKKKKTVIIISHNQDTLNSCNKVFNLNNKTITQVK